MVLLIGSITVISQNLVNNCGFNKYSTCPYNHGQIKYCTGWDSPTGGTTDYCNSCHSGGTAGVPNNLWGSQYAFEGTGYVHIISYYPAQGFYREYAQTQLACPLIAGETYIVSFYVSLSDDSKYAIDGMGLYFSNGPVGHTGVGIIPLPNGADIEIPQGQILNDKINWQLVSGTYTASGGENYITIGCFRPNAELSTQTVGGGLFLASYYIDAVTVEPVNPYFDLGNDTTLCPGETITLDLSYGCNATYLWSDGSISSNKTISSPGTYSVEITLGCGPFYDDITVSYFNKPNIPLPNDTLICPNTTIDLYAGSGYMSYEWQDGSTNNSFIANSPGLYWVEILTDIGCYIKDSVQIDEIFAPSFTLGLDTILCYGDNIILDPGFISPYLSYDWNDRSTDSILDVNTEGLYYATLTNPCGSDSDSIEIGYKNCEPDIFMPNAFSPNGDYLNDNFIAKGVNIGSFKMMIFDRWGTKVFESKSMDKGWDGKYNGSPCPTGLYVWVIHYENIEENPNKKSELIKGTVTLLR
ncbi:gliding motility-associated C-terminal domain-containing protein [Bacteroidota bacterium]